MGVELPILRPDQQVAFAVRLVEISDRYLRNALTATLKQIVQTEIDLELATYVGEVQRRKLGAEFIRAEVFCPVPSVVRANPYLLGYYRLLYGISQKTFYKGAHFGRFNLMEEKGIIRPALDAEIPDLCRSLCKTAEILIDGLSIPSVEMAHELQLLALGPQLKGGENNVTGAGAVREFRALPTDITRPYQVGETKDSVRIKNLAGHDIEIHFGSDPDVDISRTGSTGLIPLLAIEVKGGSDASNKHNRLGEAEKSHLKAKSKGHNQFWTIARLPYTEIDLRRQSPTTQRLFHLDLIRDASCEEGMLFRDLLYSIFGLPVNLTEIDVGIP